jgi:hypothetical protein
MIDLLGDPPSTLKRPTKKQLASFTVTGIGNDSVEDYLKSGFSLAICCRDCLRLLEWTPPELQRRFGDRLGLKIADIALRLSCAGEGGCGSHDVAVFPHLYEGRWSWPSAG